MKIERTAVAEAPKAAEEVGAEMTEGAAVVEAAPGRVNGKDSC